jgi:enoyl-CoA hydratase/carnithine racemase
VTDHGPAYDQLRLDISGPVALVTLDRPDRGNAVTLRMVRELSDALVRCDADDGVRAVVITGAGDAFSVGADLSSGSIDAPGESEGPADVLTEFVSPRDVRKPVIAAMNGDAVGIGVTLPLLCDLRIVARDARLALPMVRRGVIPELGSHWVLPRLVGVAVAADLMLTGRRIDGEEAARLGLCGEAIDRGEVLPRALDVARGIAEHTAPRAVAVVKHLLQRATETDLATLQQEEIGLFNRLACEPDTAEGVASFLEKRPPHWVGRASEEPTWGPPPARRDGSAA